MIYTTAFGIVWLEKAVEHMNILHPGWQEYIYSKRNRSKKAKEAREEWARVEAAISTCAKIAWVTGDELRTF